MGKNTSVNIANPNYNNNMENIFTPEYIPYYVFLEKEGLITRDIKLFGFIYFYITSTKNRFYFTNEQLAQIINAKSSKRVSNSISALIKLNLIISEENVKIGKRIIPRVINLNVTEIVSMSKKHLPIAS